MIPLRDTVPSRRPAVMVWALILANAGVFSLELGLNHEQLSALVRVFGIVPARYLGHGPAGTVPPALRLWPFLTHMFLHGGWFHIIANMWTLWIFGDNVEDRMGSVRFGVFYVLCGLAAALTHIIMNPASPVPVIGASGAISGVLGAYLLLYPGAQIIVMVPWFFWPFFFELPALVYMGVWFMTQLFSGALSLSTGLGGGVAWWAHIGGFVAGLVLCPVMVARRKRRRRIYADEYGMEGAWSAWWYGGR